MAQNLARPVAQADIPAEPMADAEYDAISRAFGETERGRRFLTEHARRNRHADTQAVLAAIARVEASIRGEPLPPPPERIRQGLLSLSELIAEADHDVMALAADSFEGSPQRANTVASTFRDLRDRIATMLDEWEEPAPAAQAEIGKQAQLPEPMPPLRLVESEPLPAKLPPAPLLISGAKAPPEQDAEPFVPFEFEPIEFESAKLPADPAPQVEDAELFAPEPRTSVPTIPATPLPPAPAISDNAAVRAKPADPMAPVRALSDEERIALFS